MTCDYCDKETIVNYQKVWKRFKIGKDEFYKEDKSFDACDIEEPIENDNIHLCKKHENIWLSGKI